MADRIVYLFQVQFDGLSTGRRLTGILARGPLARSAGGYPGSMPETLRTLTAVLHREEDWYVAQCLEVDVASQGHTIDEALASLAVPEPRLSTAIQVCY